MALSIFILMFFVTDAGAFLEGDHQFVASGDGSEWYLDKGRIEILEGNILMAYVRIDYLSSGLREVRLLHFDPERESYRELDSYTYSEEGALVDQ